MPAISSMEHFDRPFTAIMVAVVTVLDAFMNNDGVSKVIRLLLTEVMRTTELGQDLIQADMHSRIKGWRSLGVMRGVSTEVCKHRRNLETEGHIQSGYAPLSEAHQMRDFLVWLLLRNDTEFTTESSDVAGVAACLSHVAFDLLEVQGLRPTAAQWSSSPCTLHYNPEVAITQSHLTSEVAQSSKSVISAQ